MAKKGRIANLIFVIFLAAMTLLIVGVFAKQYFTYRQYKVQTLVENPNARPWRSADYELEACVDDALEWGVPCPGLPTLCEGQAHELMRECVASADRRDYCVELNGRYKSTGFGYAQCKERQAQYAKIPGRKLKNKLCNAMYRIIAEECSQYEVPQN